VTLSISHALFVERWLKKIFDYRAEMIARLMEAEDKEEERIERNREIAGQSSRHRSP
jgi:hypothetical protein